MFISGRGNRTIMCVFVTCVCNLCIIFPLFAEVEAMEIQKKEKEAAANTPDYAAGLLNPVLAVSRLIIIIIIIIDIIIIIIIIIIMI